MQASEIMGRKLITMDNHSAKLWDLLFDDRDWNVRHAVVALGRWIHDRPVLLAPAKLFTSAALAERRVSLARQDIEKAPDMTTCPPVSWMRTSPGEVFQWQGKWGVGVPAPGESTRVSDEAWAKKAGVSRDALHIRSLTEILGYSAIAGNAPWGQVIDATIDTELHHISCLRIRAKWGKDVDVETSLLGNVDWSKSEISSRAQVSPVSQKEEGQ